MADPAPIPMLLWCPECGDRHLDVGEFAVKPHHTHACQGCGMVWRPAIQPTVGVQFLPGFKNEPPRMVEPECPGPDCPLCSGAACSLCGSNPCGHDGYERHSGAA